MLKVSALQSLAVGECNLTVVKSIKWEGRMFLYYSGRAMGEIDNEAEVGNISVSA